MAVPEARWRVTPDGCIRRTSGSATPGALVHPWNPAAAAAAASRLSPILTRYSRDYILLPFDDYSD